MRSWCRNASASSDCWVSSQNWHTFAQPKASLTGRNSMICSSHDMECKDERGGCNLKQRHKERPFRLKPGRTKIFIMFKMGCSTGSDFFVFLLSVPRTGNGLDVTELLGCDEKTMEEVHRNNLNESTCLLDVSIFSSLKDFRKVAECSEEISSKCGPHVVAEHQLGFVPLAVQDFQQKVSFCWLQMISMPTLFGVEFEPVFLRFCFKKGPLRRLLLSLKKSEIASFT